MALAWKLISDITKSFSIMPVSRVAWFMSPDPLLLFAVVLLFVLLLCVLPPANECDDVPLMPLPANDPASFNKNSQKLFHKNYVESCEKQISAYS